MKHFHSLLCAFLILLSCGQRVENPLSDIDTVTPGITVNPPSTLLLSESGTTCSLAVELDSVPSGDVVINISVSNPAEGTIIAPFSGSSGTLTFTPQNWYIAQVITVQGVDDNISDGNQPLTLVFGTPASVDARYNGQYKPADITFTNVDNETPGVTVQTSVSPLLVSESGSTNSFKVVLNTQPSSNVVLPVWVSNPAEGSVTTPFSGTAGNLTFTTANWNIPQTVTVQGLPDGIADGNRSFTVSFGATGSTDPVYNSTFTPAPVSFINIDADKAGITVNAAPVNLVMEGGSGTFQMVLNSVPVSSVTITVSSSDAAAGIITTPAAGIVTFTPADWNVPKTVTVLGVTDNAMSGSRPFTVNFSVATADTVYGAVLMTPLNWIVIDTDQAGITVTEPTAYLVSKIAPATTGTFTVVLNSRPAAKVDIPLYCITGDPLPQGTITLTGPGSYASGLVSFTAADWNIPQTFTVSGLDDGSGIDKSFTVVVGAAISADPAYHGKFEQPDFYFRNFDSVTPGISITQGNGIFTTSAPVTADFFEMVLHTAPAANVDILLSVSDTTLADFMAPLTGSPATVTFTAADWNIPKRIWLTGIGVAAPGLNNYTITIGPSASGDAIYNGIVLTPINGYNSH